ncbi:MAG: superoxide dismutase [Gammaproteobacteria bacterium]|nr:superoxide dismutase [Gammaproteobacteria bacterium]
MPHALPPLPYPVEALEPVISREALELHHGAHHQAYVDKLNKALRDTPWGDEPVEQLLRRLGSLPGDLQRPVRDFGGGHANHSLLWETLTPNANRPSAHLDKLIGRDFGSLNALRMALESEAARVFGSGWVFLSWDPGKGELRLEGLPNQDSPLAEGRWPLLPCDLWEHAHYLDYHNRRDDWVRDWWHLVDWRQVERRLDEPPAGIKPAL